MVARLIASLFLSNVLWVVTISSSIAQATAPDHAQGAAGQPLELETIYPGGITLRVTDIGVQDGRISLQVLVTNNSPIAIVLNSGIPGRGMVLRDDVGNTYIVVPPQGNSTISVRSQQTLDQRFNFSGRLSPKARSLRLITNSGNGQTGRTPTVFPQIVVSGIPVR